MPTCNNLKDSAVVLLCFIKEVPLKTTIERDNVTEAASKDQ